MRGLRTVDHVLRLAPARIARTRSATPETASTPPRTREDRPFDKLDVARVDSCALHPRGSALYETARRFA